MPATTAGAAHNREHGMPLRLDDDSAVAAAPAALSSHRRRGPGPAADPDRVRERRDAALLRPDQQGRPATTTTASTPRPTALIDNDNSSTRVGLSYNQAFGAWTFENVNEFGYAPYSTGNINIINTLARRPRTTSSATPTSARSTSPWRNDRYGKFWLGQGSMATDGIHEIDLSGTDVIAYSERRRFAPRRRSSASATRTSTSTTASAASTIGDAFTNYDGPRRVRVRYDTPAFTASPSPSPTAATCSSDDSDVRDAEHLRRLAHLRATATTTSRSRPASATTGRRTTPASWGGSASALHTPTGVNVTLAVGTGRTPTAARTAATGTASSACCATSSPGAPPPLSVDYYSGRRHLPRRRRRHHQLLEQLAGAWRWCRTSTAPTPSSGSPVAATTTPTTSRATTTARRSSAAPASGSEHQGPCRSAAEAPYLLRSPADFGRAHAVAQWGIRPSIAFTLFSSHAPDEGDRPQRQRPRGKEYL